MTATSILPARNSSNASAGCVSIRLICSNMQRSTPKFSIVKLEVASHGLDKLKPGNQGAVGTAGDGAVLSAGLKRGEYL